MLTNTIAMLRLTSALLITLIVFSTQASPLPNEIASSHEKHFAGTEITNWVFSTIDSGEMYLVEFFDAETRQEAYYHSSGTLMSHLIYIENVNDRLMKLLTGNHPGSEVRRLVVRNVYEQGLKVSQLYTALLDTKEGITPVSVELENEQSLSDLLAQN